MKPVGWFALGAVVALAGAGFWYRQARREWLAKAIHAEMAADLAREQHAADSVELDRNGERLRGLEAQTQAAADQAAQAHQAAQAAGQRSAGLTAALDSARTAADSVPIMVARDSARVAEIAHLTRQATDWRKAFERERERAGQLVMDLGLARGDATRLSQAAESLRRQIASAVPPPPRRLFGLPMPGRGAALVAGVVLGVLVSR